MTKSYDMTDVEKENAVMWEQCKKLYQVLSYNGQMKSTDFRTASRMAEGMMKNSPNVPMGMTMPYFAGLTDFMQWVEETAVAKGETL